MTHPRTAVFVAFRPGGRHASPPVTVPDWPIFCHVSVPIDDADLYAPPGDIVLRVWVEASRDGGATWAHVGGVAWRSHGPNPEKPFRGFTVDDVCFRKDRDGREVPGFVRPGDLLRVVFEQTAPLTLGAGLSLVPKGGS